MYFKNNLALSTFDNIKEYIANKCRRIFRKKDYSKTGYLDIYKVEKLGKITNEFYNEIFPILEKKMLLDDENGIDFDNMPRHLYYKILELIKKKDELILEMYEDERRIQVYSEPEEINYDEKDCQEIVVDNSEELAD